MAKRDNVEYVCDRVADLFGHGGSRRMKWKRWSCSASAVKVAAEVWKGDSRKDDFGGIWNVFAGRGCERVNAVQMEAAEMKGTERMSEMSEKAASRSSVSGSCAESGSCRSGMWAWKSSSWPGKAAAPSGGAREWQEGPPWCWRTCSRASRRGARRRS